MWYLGSPLIRASAKLVLAAGRREGEACKVKCNKFKDHLQIESRSRRTRLPGVRHRAETFRFDRGAFEQRFVFGSKVAVFFFYDKLPPMYDAKSYSLKDGVNRVTIATP